MEFNRAWIRYQMLQGAQIIDIGRNPGKVAAGKEIGPFYEMELEETRFYPNKKYDPFGLNTSRKTCLR